MTRFSIFIAILISLDSVCGVAGAASAGSSAPKEPVVVFNRDNAVFGLKEGRLYAYVDLTSNAPELQKLDEQTLTKLVVAASVKAATEWWKTPRLSKVNAGVIDVITILNKDEYAKADFSSALMHGKIFLTRNKGGVVLERHTLDFANLRNTRLPHKSGQI